MRKFSLIIAILLAVFSAKAQENIGIANKVHGFYIFTDAQPVEEYEVQGEVFTDGKDDRDIKSSGYAYAFIRDHLAKKARGVNYTADGLILNIQSDGVGKAVIIKFKDTAKNKAYTKVERRQGVYVFIDSEPLTTNDFIDSFGTGPGTGTRYDVIRDYMLKKVKKKKPETEGLIIKYVANGKDVGDAVKFKK